MIAKPVFILGRKLLKIRAKCVSTTTAPVSAAAYNIAANRALVAEVIEAIFVYVGRFGFGDDAIVRGLIDNSNPLKSTIEYPLQIICRLSNVGDSQIVVEVCIVKDKLYVCNVIVQALICPGAQLAADCAEVHRTCDNYCVVRHNFHVHGLAKQFWSIPCAHEVIMDFGDHWPVYVCCLHRLLLAVSTCRTACFWRWRM